MSEWSPGVVIPVAMFGLAAATFAGNWASRFFDKGKHEGKTEATNAGDIAGLKSRFEEFRVETRETLKDHDDRLHKHGSRIQAAETGFAVVERLLNEVRADVKKLIAGQGGNAA